MKTMEHTDARIAAPTYPITQRPRRLRQLVSGISAAGVLALVVLVITVLLSSRSYGPTGSGQWVSVPQLTNMAALPQLAPGNPHVVYEVLPSGLRRSDDGGASWHKLAMPSDSQIASQGHPSLFVSPLDAHMVFMTLPAAAAQCPAARPAIYPCAIQFYSQDGGAHWTLLHLPLPGVLGSPVFYDNPSLIQFSNSQVLRAQGDRLYSAIAEPSIDVDTEGGAELIGNGARLVTSADGGVTWRIADAAIAANDQLVCDYAPTPTGSTVFALTAANVCMGAPTDLWRSDDAGKHWAHVGLLPDLAVRGLSVSSQSDGKQPLLYLSTQDVGTQVNKQGILQFSTDGGKTWEAAPNPALLEGRWFLAPLGMLSDGSVIVASLPVLGKATETFLAWKPGDQAWQQLAPPIAAGNYLLVTPDVNRGGDTLWLVTSAGTETYTAHRN